VTRKPPRIEVHLEGPSVPGRITVDALVTVAGELQATLRRILSNRRHQTGRFRGEVERICQLELTAFKAGSAALVFDLAEPRDTATLHGDQGVRAAEEMVRILQSGEAGEAQSGEAGEADWSRGVQRGILEGIDRMTKSLGAGWDEMRVRITEGRKFQEARLTPAFRGHIRAALATPPRVGDVRIEGVVWECDWRDHTAELHQADGSKVKLSFPAELDEKVTEARRRRVAVIGHTDRPERPHRVEVVDLEVLDEGLGESHAYGGFGDGLSIDELAERQGVGVPPSLESLRADWLDDVAVDEFLEVIRQVRE
jgi:hypothetical protein